MKKIITALVLFSFVLICGGVGCTPKPDKVEGSEKKVSFTGSPLYSSQKHWAFCINGEMKEFFWSTREHNKLFSGPKVLYDLEEGQGNYLIAYEIDLNCDNSQKLEAVKEIHLHPGDDINGGSENHGKGGVQKWNKVK